MKVKYKHIIPEHQSKQLKEKRKEMKDMKVKYKHIIDHGWPVYESLRCFLSVKNISRQKKQ